MPEWLAQSHMVCTIIDASFATFRMKPPRPAAHNLGPTRTSEMAAIQVTETQFDSVALRRAFGSFPTGVTVVTTLDAEGRPRGMTANSFASVSLEPALLLVCIGHGAASFSAFAQCRAFAVNVLR